MAANSRAGILLANDTLVRLDQRSTITFPQAQVQKGFFLDLLEGIGYFISRTPKSLQIRTPYVNAAVEGTEFLVHAAQNESRVLVFEGTVRAEQGTDRTLLSTGEGVVARRNRGLERLAIVDPRDAVKWALYYPPVIERGSPDAAGQMDIASAAFNRGDITSALASLDGMPHRYRGTDFYTFRASLLLYVGRVPEARSDVSRALRDDPGNGDALALLSIMSLVLGDTQGALETASEAVELSQSAAGPRIALSYAHQSRFDLEKALASARYATKIEPGNALAWARRAELELTVGDPGKARDSARKASSLNPNLSRTQSILGFAQLLSFDAEAALSSFQRAMALDQADPLPRLGLGLARIRRGELGMGRRDIEIATALDPGRSLVRSYLGKAYFEEERGTLAHSQFDWAKRLDPKDPTPWVYSAILRQTENRPVEALADLRESMALNDNRAVYRSRLLLDSDLATRSASLARIYDDLGFERLAQLRAADSVTLDPTNFSAHRFLSDSIANSPRREITRVSELLQSQLLQPINTDPLQPQLAETNLNIAAGSVSATPSFNEFTRLFARDGLRLTAALAGGNHNTFADEVVAWGLFSSLSASLGQFHYESDGFREDYDVTHDIYNIFAQAAFGSTLSVQFEFRNRHTEQGDLRLTVDPAFEPEERRELDQRTLRIGAHKKLSPRSDVVISGIFSDREASASVEPKNQPATISDVGREDGYDLQGLYLYRGDWWNLSVGLGGYHVDRDAVTTISLPGFSLPPFYSKGAVDQANAYAYWRAGFRDFLVATLGASYDSVDNEIQDLEKERISPKLGLEFHIGDKLRLRAAAFKTLKRELITSQTLEPTQIAGFDQFYDDFNGTEAAFYGLGIDIEPGPQLSIGLEGSKRELTVPQLAVRSVEEDRDEEFYRAYAYWTPSDRWAVNAEFVREHFDNELIKLQSLDTARLPLSIRYFSPQGFLAGIGVSFVQQDVRFRDQRGATDFDESFTVVDAMIGYRLPKRRGLLSLEVRNLLDERFFYQDLSFATADPFNYRSRYIPARTIFGQVTLAF